MTEIRIDIKKRERNRSERKSFGRNWNLYLKRESKGNENHPRPPREKSRRERVRERKAEKGGQRNNNKNAGTGER